MYSIAFPNIFNGAKFNLVEGREATMSNLRLLLASWKGSFIGDPYYGTNIKRFIYDPNNILLRDLVIDDIYVSIKNFMPQVDITREDIKVRAEKTSVFVTITCINIIDREVNSFDIDLTSNDF